MEVEEYIKLFHKKYRAIERFDTTLDPNNPHSRDRANYQAHAIPRTITIVEIYEQRNSDIC